MHLKTVLGLALLLLLNATASGQLRLSFQGEPYFDGAMTMSLEAPGHVGEVSLVGFGLLPLSPPAISDYGPYHIGVLLGVLPLPPIGANGRVDLPFVMPSTEPGVVGIPLVVQGFLDDKLSNPAALTMANPYYLAADAQMIGSPEPMIGANFGDTSAAGDLNDDGVMDIVVGAWFEDTGGQWHSGAAYVLWGPDYNNYVKLTPATPVPNGGFGMSATIADLNGDRVDDLIIPEGTGDPAIQTAQLHIYFGGSSFSPVPILSIDAPGAGIAYGQFGRDLVTGDFNADSFVDIAAMSEDEVLGLSHAGAVNVLFGPDFATTVKVFSPNPNAFDYFGFDLYVADLNGDEVDDLIAGSGREDVGGEVNIGRIHLFSGPGLNHYKSIENPFPEGFNSRFGNDVLALDIDGDGFAEVVASDQNNRTYVFWSPDFESYAVIARPPGLGTMGGSSVSFGYFLAAGDVNGDDQPDILVSDVFAGELNCSFGSEGVIYAAMGPYYSTFHILYDTETECSNEFGWFMTLKDLDGDGRLELMTGSPTSDTFGIQNSGRVTVFDVETK